MLNVRIRDLGMHNVNEGPHKDSCTNVCVSLCEYHLLGKKHEEKTKHHVSVDILYLKHF